MEGFGRYESAVKEAVLIALRTATGKPKLSDDLVSAEVTSDGMIVTFHYQKGAFDIAKAAGTTATVLTDVGIKAAPRDDSDRAIVEITGDIGWISQVLEGQGYQQKLQRAFNPRSWSLGVQESQR